jgi:hypothetical protein
MIQGLDCSFWQHAVSRAEDLFNRLVDLASAVCRAVADFFSGFAAAICEEMHDPEEVHGSNVSILKNTERPPVWIEDPRPEDFCAVRVNPEVIAQAPKPLDLELLARQIDEAGIVLPDDLQQLYTELFPDRKQILVHDDGELPISMEDGSRLLNCLLREIQWAVNDPAIKEMATLLKGLIFEMKKPETTKGQKQDIFYDLLRALKHCLPRQHSQIFALYSRTSRIAKTVPDLVLEYIQELKKILILNTYSLSKEPVQTYNFISKRIGNAVGLSQNLAKHDRYMSLCDARYREGNRIITDRTDGQFLTTFLKIWTPENILRGMQKLLNERIATDPDFARELGLYMQMHFSEDEGITWPEPYLLDPFMDPPRGIAHADWKKMGYQLRIPGVRRLLIHLRHLTEE